MKNRSRPPKVYTFEERAAQWINKKPRPTSIHNHTFPNVGKNYPKKSEYEKSYEKLSEKK
jgi:hypothetical protein